MPTFIRLIIKSGCICKELRTVPVAYIQYICVNVCVLYIMFLDWKNQYCENDITTRSESESHSVVSDSANPWTIQFLEFFRPEYWSGWPFPSPGDLPNPGMTSRSSALQVDSLPAEPQGKRKNTGVGSLSLLQQIFLTQESNRGLLPCRWISY